MPDKMQHLIDILDLTTAELDALIEKANDIIENPSAYAEKCRGKKSAAKRILQMMEQHAEGGLNYSGKVFISQSDFLEHAQMVSAKIEERFPNLDGKVEIYPIGATIGSHTGPGTLALFFFGDERGK